MKAFIFSDLHVNYRELDNIGKYLISHKEIGLIIFAGDVLNMGEPVGFVQKFIEVIKSTKIDFIWVPGNNDFGRGYYKLDNEFKSLEGKVINFANRNFTGVGGSPASWAGQYAGKSMIDQKDIAGSIFVSHVPPPGVHNYQKNDCQSPAVKRKFFNYPVIHICGHIHTQWGCTYLGETKIIKLAPADRGFYAILDLETLEVEFSRFN
jgi:Icc-related predicted phosphoesterase